MRPDHPVILDISITRSRVIRGAYGAGTTFVAVLNLEALDNYFLGLVSIVLFWAALIALGAQTVKQLDVPATIVIVALCSALTIVSSINLPVIAATGYAAWHMGAVTFVCLILALRGRYVYAWIGFAIFSAITVAWSVLSASDTLIGVSYSVRQAATLLIGTLFAILLRRSAFLTHAISARHVIRSVDEAAYEADVAERLRMLTRLETHARPALDRIVAGPPFTDGELQNFALLEASLRDGIRAAGFTSPAVAQEIHSARRRGVVVTLLDDRGSDLVANDLARVEEALIAELQRTHEGTLTARLSPADREEIATIVIGTDGRFRRIVITDQNLEIFYLPIAASP
jgi:hypothetical protein